MPFADPITDKLLLALFGALLGWSFKAGWDEVQLRRRWRRLGPLILRQVAVAAAQCTQAFDAAALPRIAVKLDSVQSSAIEMVAVGVATRSWLDGLVQLSDAMDVLQAAQTATVSQRGEALEALRSRGTTLQAWAAWMQKDAQGT